ncbi:recombinase family protein [Streptomyces erythrochromogenes]|uniref:recombinase family protein n=1 Tax=Streptomyces erythrochromogenes TaxID=285574 RepID=UPI0033D64B97
MNALIPKSPALYCRLSYAPDGSLEKVERQEADGRRMGLNLGWPAFCCVYVDNSRSAWQRNRKRPDWDRMLLTLDADSGRLIAGDPKANHHHDGIMTYHGDRLIRQPYDLELLLNIADTRRIPLASVSGVRDLSNPDDRFILRIEAAQACRESDNTSRRVRRALNARADRGLSQVGGSRAFGFGVQIGTRVKLDPKTGEEIVVPVFDHNLHVPEEAEYAADAVDLQLAGLSQNGVVKWLNARCTTTEGNEWTTKTWRDYVLRPRIAGLIERHGELVKAAWDGIIEVDNWMDIKAIYEKSAEEYPYAGRERKYVLSTVAECGNCDGIMRGRPVGGKDKPRRKTRYSQLYCPVCKKVSRKNEHVDAFVKGRVLRLLNDPRFAIELHAATDDGTPGISAQIAQLERRRAEKAKQLEDLADDPDIDLGLAMRAVASFDRKITALRAELATTEELRRLTRLVGITPDQWDAEPVEVRSATVKSLFRVVILPTTHRGPGFDPSSVALTRRRLVTLKELEKELAQS